VECLDGMSVYRFHCVLLERYGSGSHLRHILDSSCNILNKMSKKSHPAFLKLLFVIIGFRKINIYTVRLFVVTAFLSRNDLTLSAVSMSAPAGSQFCCSSSKDFRICKYSITGLCIHDHCISNKLMYTLYS